MKDLFGTVKRRQKESPIGLQANSKDDSTDVWLTPPEIVQSLGEFDLDPCAAIDQPWDTAKKMWTIKDDGFNQDWFGRVWCNPPYSEVKVWIEKLANHGNGIGLIFARTGTRLFMDTVFKEAHSILFVDGRIKFYRSNGVRGKSGPGAYSVLIAFGENNTKHLKGSGIRGKIIEL